MSPHEERCRIDMDTARATHTRSWNLLDVTEASKLDERHQAREIAPYLVPSRVDDVDAGVGQ